MKPQQLLRLGLPEGTPLRLAREFIRNFMAAGNPSSGIETGIFQVVADPAAFFRMKLSVYKDIHTVMAAQSDLVEILGRFDPKLVKMCPAGEKAED